MRDRRSPTCAQSTRFSMQQSARRLKVCKQVKESSESTAYNLILASFRWRVMRFSTSVANVANDLPDARAAAVVQSLATDRNIRRKRSTVHSYATHRRGPPPRGTAGGVSPTRDVQTDPTRSDQALTQACWPARNSPPRPQQRMPPAALLPRPPAARQLFRLPSNGRLSGSYGIFRCRARYRGSCPKGMHRETLVS